jgi:tetratricopeptide (TPR) repeat protein
MPLLVRALSRYGVVNDAAHASSEALVKRGKASQEKGDREKAIADYTKAIEHNPRNTTAYVHRGYLYKGKGVFAKAVADFTWAIELPGDRERSGIYSARAGACRAMGDYDQAIADYTEAIKSKPADFDGSHDLFERAQTYRAKGDYERAVEDYSAVVELEPWDSSVHQCRGRAYEAGGRTVRALVDFKHAIEIALDDEDYASASEYCDRAELYLAEGRAEEAKNDATKAIQTRRRADDESGEAYAPEKHKRGFDVFVRASKALKDKSGGAGS